MRDDETTTLSCAEARDLPIEMPEPERRRALAHIFECDHCRTYFAARTCD